MPRITNSFIYSQKLRRVMRRAYDACEHVFKKKTLLKELTNYVVEDLGDFYPELERNISLVRSFYKETCHRRLNFFF